MRVRAVQTRPKPPRLHLPPRGVEAPLDALLVVDASAGAVGVIGDLADEEKYSRPPAVAVDGVLSMEVGGAPLLHSLGDQTPPRLVTPGLRGCSIHVFEGVFWD